MAPARTGDCRRWIFRDDYQSSPSLCCAPIPGLSPFQGRTAGGDERRAELCPGRYRIFRAEVQEDLSGSSILLRRVRKEIQRVAGVNAAALYQEEVGGIYDRRAGEYHGCRRRGDWRNRGRLSRQGGRESDCC